MENVKIFLERTEDARDRIKKIMKNTKAFPIFMRESHDEFGIKYSTAQSGMDIKTYLAGQAIAGIMANPELVGVGYDVRVHMAIKIADLMVEKL